MYRKRRGPDGAATNENRTGVHDESGTTEDAVAAFEAQAALADRVHSIDTTNLSDPHTNPNVLAEHNAARDEADREIIALEHTRRVRQAHHAHARALHAIDTEDRWVRSEAQRDERMIAHAHADAEEAAADLEAIRAFERCESPATAARAVSTARPWWARLFLVIAIVASVASAVGIANLAMATTGVSLAGAVGIGAVTETILTVLVTMIIAHQAHLETHLKARRDPHTQMRGTGYPWVVVAGLLLVSIGLNTWGLAAGTTLYGAIGIVGALVAALCSGMAWVSSQSAGDVIAANVAAFHSDDWATHRAELHRRAAGDYVPTRARTATSKAPSPGNPHSSPDSETGDTSGAARVRELLDDATVTEAMFAGITRGLDDLGGEGGTPALTGPPGGTGDDQGKHAPLPESAEVAAAPGGIGSDQPERASHRSEATPGGGGTGSELGKHTPGEPHHQARVAAGEANRRRVADYIATHGVEVANRAIGRALGLARSTVREHRDTLHQLGHHVYPTP
ncbi:DMT family transporter [Halostreptopolyspora alba]|uniref:DMT family transporter n=1 Tax=Halostreptopolyspora alba TaxID=2487137 RepID=A0A3N0E6U5_9ACTN|nr:DMT family transporter [Nocardiopsaceae bacterium YIM 96095]